MKTRWRKIGRWAAIGLLGVLCALTVAVAFVVGTDPGRRWLAKQVSQALSTEQHAVQLEGIHLAWPLDVAIDRGTATDSEGVWLDLRDVGCKWNPLVLLSSRIEIRSLRIRSLDLARLPDGESTEPTETNPLRLPEWVVNTVELGRVRLAEEVFGFPAELTQLQGRLAGGAKEGAVRIEIEAQAAGVKLADVAEEQVATEIELWFSPEDWGLSGSLSAEGLSVASELAFPGSGAWPMGTLNIRVDGSAGPVGDMWPGLSASGFTFSLDSPPEQDGLERVRAHLAAENVRFGEQAVETVTMEMQLRRTNAQPGLLIEAEVQAKQFSYGELNMADAEFHIDGPWGALDLSSKASGAFFQPFALDAAAHLRWDGEDREMELKQASVQWAEAQARLTEPLRVWIQGEQSSIQGAAKLESFDLASVTNAVFEMLEGLVAGEVRVGGSLAAPEIEGTVSCAEWVAKTASRTAGPPVNGSGRFSFSGGLLSVSAEAQTATNGTTRLKAQVPAQLSLVPWKLALDRDREVSVELAADVELALLRGFEALAGVEVLEGRVHTDLSVQGTLASPAVVGELRGEGLAARNDVWEQVPPVAGFCRLNYSNGIWHAVAEAGTSTNGSISLQAQVPARMSLVPWELTLDRDRDNSVNLEAALDLAMLNGHDAFANGRISGQIHLSMEHVGSVSSGSVTGVCTLVDGEYENYSLGTVIDEGQLRLTSRGKVLVVESGSATDGGRGELTLSGTLRPDVTKGLPYELELDFREVRLLRRPDAEAMVSGKLVFAGTSSQLDVKGDMEIDHALVDLRNLRPPTPAVLEPTQEVVPKASSLAPDRDFNLRLALSIPGSLFVRSSTLDTVWAGNLVLTHERGEPGLRGHLEPRRGTVLLLKRPFKLEEGQINFAGRWPPEPQLRLTAMYSRADLSAQALITGPARDPDITLTSTPSLPEDEILSRILFGENMASLTPLQAISLASEVSRLRNVTGGAGGMLDDMQAALGIDRVEFRETGQDMAEPEIAIGKYMGDRSYVEVRRAASMDSTEGSQFFLEHSLRPNLVLEAESGMGMRSGAGIFWRREY